MFLKTQKTDGPVFDCCIKVECSSEDEEKLTCLSISNHQPMPVEKPPPAEDKPCSRGVAVIDLFQGVNNKANVCQLTQVPVFFRVRFRAKTKLNLVGFELLSRSFAPTDNSKR